MEPIKVTETEKTIFINFESTIFVLYNKSNYKFEMYDCHSDSYFYEVPEDMELLFLRIISDKLKK